MAHRGNAPTANASRKPTRENENPLPDYLYRDMNTNINNDMTKAVMPGRKSPVRLATTELLTDGVKERLQVYDRTCSTFYMIVGSAYNCAHSAMVDAVNELKTTKWWRHNIKKESKAALQCYDVLNRRLRLQLSDRYLLWLDVTDSVYEEMQPHIRNLFFVCDAALLRNGIEDHRLRALMLTASAVIDVARNTFDDVMETSRRAIGVDLTPLFAEGTFKDVQHHWNNCVAPMLVTPGHEDLDLHDDANCRLAVDVILARMADLDMFDRAGAYGMQYNEEVVRKYGGMDKEKET